MGNSLGPLASPEVLWEIMTAETSGKDQLISALPRSCLARRIKTLDLDQESIGPHQGRAWWKYLKQLLQQDTMRPTSLVC